eukprot:6196795-Pleurochrysis_carterae.AAC.1
MRKAFQSWRKRLWPEYSTQIGGKEDGERGRERERRRPHRSAARARTAARPAELDSPACTAGRRGAQLGGSARRIAMEAELSSHALLFSTTQQRERDATAMGRLQHMNEAGDANGAQGLLQVPANGVIADNEARSRGSRSSEAVEIGARRNPGRSVPKDASKSEHELHEQLRAMTDAEWCHCLCVLDARPDEECPEKLSPELRLAALQQLQSLRKAEQRSLWTVWDAITEQRLRRLQLAQSQLILKRERVDLSTAFAHARPTVDAAARDWSEPLLLRAMTAHSAAHRPPTGVGERGVGSVRGAAQGSARQSSFALLATGFDGDAALRVAFALPRMAANLIGRSDGEARSSSIFEAAVDAFRPSGEGVAAYEAEFATPNVANMGHRYKDFAEPLFGFPSDATALFDLCHASGAALSPLLPCAQWQAHLHALEDSPMEKLMSAVTGHANAAVRATAAEVRRGRHKHARTHARSSCRSHRRAHTNASTYSLARKHTHARTPARPHARTQ